MFELTIAVAQEDISCGVRMHCNRCPIARAMNRYFGPDANADVGTKTISVWTGSGWESQLRFTVPEDARNFILDFDDKKPVSPQSFAFALDSD